VNTNPTGGQVLGAETELPAGCSAYLEVYLKRGSSNSVAVKKLQSFLNEHLGLSLPVTGIFGSMTHEAVNTFQVKYSDEILKPWFDQKLSDNMDPSGYVYKMTKHKINLIKCATLNAPVPQLP
jgi:peptidoglycan hydrolase-like protein with peptidoglycan-binding domain